MGTLKFIWLGHPSFVELSGSMHDAVPTQQAATAWWIINVIFILHHHHNQDQMNHSQTKTYFLFCLGGIRKRSDFNTDFLRATSQAETLHPLRLSVWDRHRHHLSTIPFEKRQFYYCVENHCRSGSSCLMVMNYSQYLLHELVVCRTSWCNVGKIFRLK